MRYSMRRTDSRFLFGCLFWSIAWTGVWLGAGPSAGAAETSNEDARFFNESVAPLLARRCLGCHNATEKEGGLDLSEQTAAAAGGDSGPALVGQDLGESNVWQRVSDDEMPPKHPLPQDEKEILKRWILSGAVWGDQRIDPFRWSTADRAGYDWWSLQPLQHAATPAPDKASEETLRWARNPIDHFIIRKLQHRGLAPSPEVDRRTLIRRLSFDLLGLPPTYEDVEQFAADRSPQAYERLVDRLLASPRYGERWARHWLDVVRFGESQGFERDQIRPNAWRYRDWVIQAFNHDLPYDAFARRQLAGDVLQPNDADAITATGFLVAGPYDSVGQMQQSVAMRAVVRQDELEDIVGAVGQTFLGLTVNCARCHDHKFDPILQKEYYQLTAALGGVRHGERPLMTPPMREQIAKLEQRRAELQNRIANLEQPVLAALRREHETDERGSGSTSAPRPFARWDFNNDLQDSIGKLHASARGAAKTENGRLILDGKTAFVVTPPIEKPLPSKTLEAWVQLAYLEQSGGGVLSVQSLDGQMFDAIVYAERQSRIWTVGSDGFRRTKDLQAASNEDLADRQLVHIAIVYHADGRIECYRNGRPYGAAYKSNGPAGFQPGGAQIVFGLRHGTVAGGNRMLAGQIDRAQVYDRALSAEEVAASFAASPFILPSNITARLSASQRTQRDNWRAAIVSHDQQIARLRNRKAYAVTPRAPETTHVLLRGNPASLGDVVSANGISSLGAEHSDFQLPADAPDAARRRELAAWIASPHNPLFARVMANRIWHYHFGVGIVDTPNDFGFNGGRPSHPELLDFLANRLIANDWSLKCLQRLIVTSAAYRQQTGGRPLALKRDAQNRLLWRREPHRMEAETLRDAMLAVAGMLNQQLGGPPYQDFKTSTFNSQFYEMIDPVGPAFHRRTIYRTWVRSGRSTLLDAFDCPDPSTMTPNRAVTTTPVQSLSLLNNAFVLRMAAAAATRVKAGAAEDAAAQVVAVFRLAYQRRPDEAELRAAAPFVEQHGLPAFCRIVFNSNEFLFID